jgi:hypothetical protein
MKDTDSAATTDTNMTLKKLDDPTSRDFWEYIEKSKQDWREQRPSWSKDLDDEREKKSAAQSSCDKAALNC